MWCACWIRRWRKNPAAWLLADRFAGWFVAVLLLAAAASYLGWLAIAPDRALWIMVAVLVVSCPCAVAGHPSGADRRHRPSGRIGMLTTRGHALETLAKVSDAVFDKTGTLTHGDMRLLQPCPWARCPRPRRWRWRAAWKPTPITRLFRAFAAAEHANTRPGAGRSQLSGGLWFASVSRRHTWRLGKPDYVAALAGPLPAALAGWRDDATVVALGSAHGWRRRSPLATRCATMLAR